MAVTMHGENNSKIQEAYFVHPCRLPCRDMLDITG